MTEAAEVTQEILDLAVSVTDDRYSDDRRIDWEDALDRMDGVELDDGSRLDLGSSMASPAVKAIKKHVRDLRRDTPR